MIPLSYNVRSILRRRFSAFATAGGLGLVVFVFAAVLMLARGVEETLKSTGVRENAIVLAEAALPHNPELVNALLRMEHDPDRRVQFQLLCTLGGIGSPASVAVQDRLLAKHIEDPWMQGQRVRECATALHGVGEFVNRIFQELVALLLCQNVQASQQWQSGINQRRQLPSKDHQDF